MDMTGLPRSQALPSSMTRDPSSARRSRNRGAKADSQSTYASPVRFPYLFLVFNGNGGDVRMRLTVPLRATREAEERMASAVPCNMQPYWVLYATGSVSKSRAKPSLVRDTANAPLADATILLNRCERTMLRGGAQRWRTGADQGYRMCAAPRSTCCPRSPSENGVAFPPVRPPSPGSTQDPSLRTVVIRPDRGWRSWELVREAARRGTSLFNSLGVLFAERRRGSFPIKLRNSRLKRASGWSSPAALALWLLREASDEQTNDYVRRSPNAWIVGQRLASWPASPAC